MGGAGFRERLGTEEACRKALFEMRRREGLTCPARGGRGFRELRARKVLRRNRCERRARPTAGTVLQDGEPPPAVWLRAIYRLAQGKGGISPVGLGRRLGVRQGTAWLIKRELMRAMAEREAGKPKLSGRAEVDDACLGGGRQGGERGRGAAGETPFVAAAETTAERAGRDGSGSPS